MNLFAHIKAMEVIGAEILFIGTIACLINVFRVQIKYNGGLF